MNRTPLGLFSGFGIELEYMIVNRQSLSLMPIADLLIADIAGCISEDAELEGVNNVTISNELVAHVIELKTTRPNSTLAGLDESFQSGVNYVNERLVKFDACLLPSAAHPWMNPQTDTQLWPGANNEIYQTFDRIFDCQGHGWSNLQSVHVNLPFANDEEFGRLHAAIRILLPILPALAASSPILNEKVQSALDARMVFYATNCARVPSVTGEIIPEAVFNREDYERYILQTIYKDMSELDPGGILRHEWVNARGATARFSRSSIEIRVLDIQECPKADLAICRLIVAVLQTLVDETWSSYEAQQRWSVEALKSILDRTIRHADQAILDNSRYLKLLGAAGKKIKCASDLWRSLYIELIDRGRMKEESALDVILNEGCLATRILRSLDGTQHLSRLKTHGVYQQLTECLRDGSMFE